MPIKLLPMVATAFLTFFIAADAAERLPYDAERFAAAQESGKPILIDISAAWCPTCKRQKPIIESVVQQPAYDDLMVFDVDFDAQKDVVRRFGATMQSTLIVFRGKDEKGRSVGGTDAVSIARLVASSVSP
ncbi:thioredoxin family protein [Methylocapsa aurea]|uniref:thioredoxin family protein n=1 Tax=Methylocapsa aurea TaxID=663610 RepID=UPI00055BFB7A|nr:thioredoxin family protein [Methylocapsa aurea]